MTNETEITQTAQPQDLTALTMQEIIALAAGDNSKMLSLMAERDAQFNAKIKAAKSNRNGNSGVYFVVTPSGHFSIRGTRNPMHSPFFYVDEAEFFFSDEVVIEIRAFIAKHKADFTRPEETRSYKLRATKSGELNVDGGKLEKRDEAAK